jgi:hypothetical protein
LYKNNKGMKTELYSKGIDLADFSAADYVSIYPGRNFGFIIDFTDGPATLKITDELGNTGTYTFDSGYHPIQCTKIWKVGSSITSCKVIY